MPGGPLTTEPAPAPPAAPPTKARGVDYTDPNKGPAVRRMFAGIARRYDFLNHLLSFNRDKAWRRCTVRRSQLRGDERVLDVCCGTGDLTLGYVQALPQGTAIGADFTPEMVVLARGKATQARVAADFLVADTLALPFADGTFDVCSVAFGIRNVQDVRAGIAEMARMVKPGGKVVILELCKPKSGLGALLCRIHLKLVLPVVGRMISRDRDRAYAYLPQSIEIFSDRLDVAALMRECGLEVVVTERMNFGSVALMIGQKATPMHQGTKG